MVIKTPHDYISEADIVKSAGNYINKIGSNPLFVGGAKALEAVWKNVSESCKENGIVTDNVETFEGFPSERQFEKYLNIVNKNNNDVIVGIGGGRVLDTVKAVGELADIPVVTIPTIAATCAAWAALTVQYDDEGAFVKMRPLKEAPVLVLADTKVILKAPVRFLNAGIVDTFAKLYENRPTFEKHPQSISLDISVYGSKIAFDKLLKQSTTAIEEAEKDIFGKAAKDVVDAIIYLAGFAGSFNEDIEHYSFAHPFYHVSTRLPNTRGLLHGEKVAYGIVAQLFLENKPDSEIRETIKLFDKYNAAFTLEDMGISQEKENNLNFLKSDVKKAFPFVEWEEQDIKQALIDADNLIREVRGEINGAA